MTSRSRKWHHRLLGTVDDRRRWRDVLLRKVGLARTHVPMELVRRKELALPNVVRGLAADRLVRQHSLTFVQVGAFDGQSDDDLTSLLDFEHVRGVLVEPQPEPFEKLQKRFAGHENLQLVNAAIARDADERPLYSPRCGASRLASFDRQNLIRHGVDSAEIVSKQVRCLPLEKLLEQAGFDQLDVLQIDAEGYDLEVLATLDLDRWRPTVIRLEYRHLPPREVDDCLRRLSARGYRFLLQERDLVASLIVSQVGRAA
ncbi:MAG: FkbM family methyltransferase [Aeoliella sp.]